MSPTEPSGSPLPTHLTFTVRCRKLFGIWKHGFAQRLLGCIRRPTTFGWGLFRSIRGFKRRVAGTGDRWPRAGGLRISDGYISITSRAPHEARGLLMIFGIGDISPDAEIVSKVWKEFRKKSVTMWGGRGTASLLNLSSSPLSENQSFYDSFNGKSVVVC